MKTILLLVHDDEGQDARLEAALGLCVALEAHLHCIDVTAPSLFASEVFAGLGETTLLKDERGGDARSDALRDRLAREDVSWSWRARGGDIASCMIEAATLADLIVMNSGLADHPVPDMRAIVSRILLHIRTPVLAVPPTLERFEFDRALVAWDGRGAGASALRASVPLLRLARAVRIITIGEEPRRPGPRTAARYLAFHGIDAEVALEPPAQRNVGEGLAAACRRWTADYLVMGAYGRGRFRESFGGVTRSLLRRSDLPLLLCH